MLLLGGPVVEIETTRAILVVIAPVAGVVRVVAARESATVDAGAVPVIIELRKSRRAAGTPPR